MPEGYAIPSFELPPGGDARRPEITDTSHVTPEPAPFDPLTFDPTVLTDAELAALLNELEGEEETASRRRGSLHNRIEFVHAGGGASAEMAEDQLATMQTNERDLSGRRRALHLRIDLLRAERSRRLV